MSGRGRSLSSRSSRGRSSRSVSPIGSSESVLKSSRGARVSGRARGTMGNNRNRPKFNDNPPAPEIVEKTALNGSETSDSSPKKKTTTTTTTTTTSSRVPQEAQSETEERPESSSSSSEPPTLDYQSSSLLSLKQRLLNGSIPDIPSLKAAVSQVLSQQSHQSHQSQQSQHSPQLSSAVHQLLLSHIKTGGAPEGLSEETLSNLISPHFSETPLLYLDQLDSNMVPVEAVTIQEFRVQGDEEDPSLKKPPSSLFDKSALFSQMEDTFAKDTQEALKHRPVYSKAHHLHDTADNKENERLKNNGPSGNRGSPSPPVLLPEMEPRDLHNTTVPTKPAPNAAPSLLTSEKERVWPTVLSRTDAETAALALSFSLSRKPSLKTVIRVPHTPSGGPSSLSSKKKTKGHHAKNVQPSSPPPPPPASNVEEVVPPEQEEESSLVIDEDNNNDEETLGSPRSSPLMPPNNSHHHTLSNNQTTLPTSGGKNNNASSPDSHKSEDKPGPPESMVVPEKASSFNIHPERCCSDMCHYCGLKFGMLDTPLHVSQLKTSEVRKKVEDITGFEKDACLCDKCFRYLDRRAKSVKNQQQQLGESGELSGGSGFSAGTGVSTASFNDQDKRKKDESSRKGEDRKCIVRNCNREVSENVSKKWLVRLKKKLVRKISLDWERVGRGSVKSSFPVCHKHHSWVDFYSSCGLCKKKLSVGGICTLGISKQEVHELNVLLREDRIPAELLENHFVCKLCRTFCNIKLKSAISPDVFRNQKVQKGFIKDYKKRLYQCLRLDGGETPESVGEGLAVSSSNGGSKTPKKIHQVSQSDNPTKITIKTTTLPMEYEEEGLPSSSERPARKRRGGKEVFSGSPSSIKVSESSSCSVSISFDLNTKKLWQDMHFPYGNYTAFFRHLILLEKFWRNGDLQLSETATEKSSVYIKSVYNRIRAYEGGRSNVKKSSLSSDVVDLSASTRPDLSKPPVPLFLHEEIPEDEKEEDPSYQPPAKDKYSPEILKIPKVPRMSSDNNQSSVVIGGNIDDEDDLLNSPPTKIRVRKDLMHLGLIVKPVPNLMNDKTVVNTLSSTNSNITTTATAPSSTTPIVAKAPQTPSSSCLATPPPSKAAASVVMTPPSSSSVVPSPLLSGAKKSSPHTISSMLNDSSNNISSSSPISSNNSIIHPRQTSSNAKVVVPPINQSSPSPTPAEKQQQQQLIFSKEQSSAIPLTFNNSIAEVLEAANKASKAQSAKESPVVSMSLASKPEITITAKPPLPKPPTTSGKVIPPHTPTVASSSWMLADHHNHQLKAPAAASKKTSSSVRSPILDMTKLLQTASPILPPHLVAQDHIGSSKVPLPRHPSSVNPRMQRPSSSHIMNHQKNKNCTNSSSSSNSINNILDRLNGLKGANKSSAQSSSSQSSSSLVQQLQAPPQMILPTSPPRMTAPAQQVAAAAAAQQLMWALHPPPGNNAAASSASSAGNKATTGNVNSSLVQYDWLSQTQALMMAGALPTLDQVQAAQRVQAFQELMNMGMGGKQGGAAGATNRLRAPPPLTHMGGAKAPGSHPPPNPGAGKSSDK